MSDCPIAAMFEKVCDAAQSDYRLALRVNQDARRDYYAAAPGPDKVAAKEAYRRAEANLRAAFLAIRKERNC